MITFQTVPTLLTMRPPWEPFDLRLAEQRFPISHYLFIHTDAEGNRTEWMRADRWPMSTIPEEETDDEATDEGAPI